MDSFSGTKVFVRRNRVKTFPSEGRLVPVNEDGYLKKRTDDQGPMYLRFHGIDVVLNKLPYEWERGLFSRESKPFFRRLGRHGYQSPYLSCFKGHPTTLTTIHPDEDENSEQRTCIYRKNKSCVVVYLQTDLCV